MRQTKTEIVVSCDWCDSPITANFTTNSPLMYCTQVGQIDLCNDCTLLSFEKLVSEGVITQDMINELISQDDYRASARRNNVTLY